MVASSSAATGNGEEARLIVDGSNGERSVSLYGTAGVSTNIQAQGDDEVEAPAPKAHVSWSNLPNKGQLSVLIIARLSEPLVQTSLQVRRGLALRCPDAYQY
jgi:hypothetical protein